MRQFHGWIAICSLVLPWQNIIASYAPIYSTNAGLIVLTGYTGTPIAVTIPNFVSSINQQAFFMCDSLSSITLGKRVASIGIGAFQGCANLSSVVIGNAVTNIDCLAFFGCTSLTGLKIPDSVTTIGYSAFFGCTNLATVIMGGGIADLGDDAFGAIPNTQILFTGNAPPSSVGFPFSLPTTVYYLPGTAGWNAQVGNYPGMLTALWNPSIQTTMGSYGINSNGFTLSVTGTANIPVAIRASTDLSSGMWTTVQTCNLTNGSVTFADSTWTNYPNRFYSVGFP